MNNLLLAFFIWIILTLIVIFLFFKKNKSVYIICPVRNVTYEQQKEIDLYVSGLEMNGYCVHYPPRDVDQSDPSGVKIVLAHRSAMQKCGRVDIFWDVESSGSHFDLGMAIVLGKPIRLIKSYQVDGEGKSYLKVIKELMRLSAY